MLRIFLVAAFALVSVCAEGEFIILHSPGSVQFDGSQPLSQSMLKDVFTAILGFTVQPYQQYDGVSIIDPFGLPEAVVGIFIEGDDSLGSSRDDKFTLNVDENEERTWQDLRKRLENKDDNNTLIRINVGDGFEALGQSALGELKPIDIERPLYYLNRKNEVDNEFIREIILLRAIARKVSSNDIPKSKSDVYWLIVTGLGPIIDSYGKESNTAKEAFDLLDDALKRINKAFDNAYDGKVVIAAFTSNSNKVLDTRSMKSRIRRAAESNMTEEEKKFVTESEGSNNETNANLEITTVQNNITESTESSGHELNHPTHKTHSQTNDENTDEPVEEPTPISQLNLAKKYNKDYPVIFNIILWFGVIFVFSLLAVCITIADMDPGRDSIIYRMTSNRMKKDN